MSILVSRGTLLHLGTFLAVRCFGLCLVCFQRPVWVLHPDISCPSMLRSGRSDLRATRAVTISHYRYDGHKDLTPARNRKRTLQPSKLMSTEELPRTSDLLNPFVQLVY